MDNRVYWIWLQQAFGEGSPLPWKIFKGYPGGIREFYEGGPRLWNTRRDISDQKAEGLYHFTLEAAKARLDYALSLGWEVLTPESGRFPGTFPIPRRRCTSRGLCRTWTPGPPSPW